MFKFDLQHQGKIPYCFGNCFLERRLDSGFFSFTCIMLESICVSTALEHYCRISLEEQSAFTELLK